MNKKDSLGDRMKRYESIPKHFLTRKIPVIARVDGRAFHTFTKGFNKPFDNVLTLAMQDTMQRLCEEVQGCTLGYTQSDEITLVIVDYMNIESDAWFGYNVEKMCSLLASIATLAFNQSFSFFVKHRMDIFDINNKILFEDYDKVLNNAVKKGATFDARVFSLPKEEVCNCLIWRQQDAMRNSIQALGQAHFSHRQLQGLSCDEIQDLLWKERDINWNDTPTQWKRGSCCVKQYKDGRSKWIVDRNIPIFTQDRNYVDSRVYEQERFVGIREYFEYLRNLSKEKAEKEVREALIRVGVFDKDGKS